MSHLHLSQSSPANTDSFQREPKDAMHPCEQQCNANHPTADLPAQLPGLSLATLAPAAHEKQAAPSASYSAHAGSQHNSNSPPCSPRTQQMRQQAIASARARAAAELNFAMSERPPWRPSELPSTSQMLREATAWSQQYSTLSPIQEAVVRQLALRFVVASDMIELVGMADAPATVCLLDGRTYKHAASQQQMRETLQTHKALIHLQQLQQEMRAAISDAQQLDGPSTRAECAHLTAQCALITEQMLMRTQHELMRSIQGDAGKYRTAEAFTMNSDGPYFYAKPEHLHSQLVCLVDTFNDLLTATPADAGIDWFAKLAAWLLHRLVCIHPWSDGNGRMGRVLASFVLSVVCPFPVAVWPSSSNKRGSYIDAVRAATAGNQLLPPADLAAMLLESVWRGWAAVAAAVAQAPLVHAPNGMRGELFAPAFDAMAYKKSLTDIGLSEEQKQEEQAVIRLAIQHHEQHRQHEQMQQQQQVEVVTVALQRNTYCVLAWWDV